MSIVVSVKVHDGIVLGAESMTQIFGSDAQGTVGVVKTYENAQKLYQVGELPMGVMAYGIGNIGPRSIGSFISEFSRKVGDIKKVEDVAKELSGFLKKVHEEGFKDLRPEQRPDLGVFIGGYSEGEPLAEEWEFNVPRAETPKRVRPLAQFGASWRGVSIPFTRLYRGIDPRLEDELIKAGVKKEILDKFAPAPIVFDGMPVQEAIDFAVFILQTTINMAKFEIGPPSCGGPLWVAVISPLTKFQLVQRPAWKAE